MGNIDQLVKKSSQSSSGYRDVTPKTFTDAVIDRKTKESLESLISKNNFIHLPYVGSKEATRLLLDEKFRRKGLWVGYVLYDKTLVVEYYNSDYIDDNHWKDSSYWVPYNSAGDIKLNEDDLVATANGIGLADRDDSKGMAKVILRANKPITEQLLLRNCIYEIRYNFNLNNEELVVPDNCILDFQGGSISNGNIIGNNTLINAINTVFNNVSVSGSFSNTILYLEWFDIENTVASSLITSIIGSFTNVNTIEFPKNKTIRVNSYIYYNNSNKNIVINGNGCTLKGEGSNGFMYFNIISNYTYIHDINIDNSACDNNYWDASSLSEMKFFRGINNNSKIVKLDNIKISNIWGYAINTSCSSFADISNIILEDVGGLGKTSATDAFGDALYFAVNTGNEIININNVKAVGKVNGETNSRIGVVCEALDGIADANGTLHLNINNCNFKNFNRSIHLENILNNKCIITINNSEFTHCGIHFWSYNDTYDILSATNSRFVCNKNNFQGNAGLCRWIKEVYLSNCYVSTEYSTVIYGDILTRIDNSEIDVQDLLCAYNSKECNITNSRIKFKTDLSNIILESPNVNLDNCTLSMATGNTKKVTSFFNKVVNCTINDIYPTQLNQDRVYNNKFYIDFRGSLDNNDYYNCGNNQIYANGSLECDGSNSLTSRFINGRVARKYVEVELDFVPWYNNRIYGINKTMFIVHVPYPSWKTGVDTIQHIMDGGLYYITTLKAEDVQYKASHRPIKLGYSDPSIGISFSGDMSRATPSSGCAYDVILLSPNEISLLPDGDKLRNIMYKPDNTPYYLTVNDGGNLSASAFTLV